MVQQTYNIRWPVDTFSPATEFLKHMTQDGSSPVEVPIKVSISTDSHVRQYKAGLRTRRIIQATRERHISLTTTRPDFPYFTPQRFLVTPANILTDAPG
jgi:hypothetical protein